MASIIDYTKGGLDALMASLTAAINAKYTKPVGGIPGADLATSYAASSALTTGLAAKADLTAGAVPLGQIPSGIPLTKLSTTGTASSTTVLYGDGAYRTPTGGTATTDASQLTTGTLSLARLPSIPAANLAADVATQAELDAATAATAAGYMRYVNHGATAGTARPSGAAPVYWTGSVAPTNAVAYDFWYDTTT